MNYEETLQFLYNQLPAYHRIGKAAYKSDLSNTIVFDNYLGAPHRNYRTIHIGGTNGKGSVSHMTASVLMEAGLKTGLYTSPHLMDFRERIKVNGAMIPKQNVINFIRKHSGIIGRIKPSFFEMTVAMAFDYFARENVDVAVIEVGLGGRLDSTNIIMPVLSVITNIGHDHMDLLGDTLEKVAWEKAGIIKSRIPAVIGETQEQTKNVFIAKARETDSPVFFADQNYKCTLDEPDYSSESRNYEITESPGGRRIKGSVGLKGDYQKKNIQTVFQSFQILKGMFPLSDDNLANGIRKVTRNTGLMGRWQIIGRDPLMICDTGHNREGISYVLEQLRKIKKGETHFVIGFVNDKDLGPVLPLFPADAKYYFTKASVPRALDSKELKEKAHKCGLKGESFGDVASAIRSARQNSSLSDLIFIGGSTFIVADALSYLNSGLFHQQANADC
ncbi:MAG: bifunctional folylpolyglutamate synthase/dihydrofolate synthase [Bacteroidales bacterium]|nr:bifunctional folylpolyglutamate synthase/dihydrofolate synthase [Bacteroidales bacterium]